MYCYIYTIICKYTYRCTLNKYGNFVIRKITLSNENEASDGNDNQCQDFSYFEDILDPGGCSHTDQVNKGQYT